MAVVPPRHMYVFGDQNIFWDCCGPNAGGSIRLCFQQDMQTIKDMREGLDRAGFGDTVFEIKSLNIGLVVRVYLIQARNRAEIYSKVISDRLEASWYKKHIWLTQVVDVERAEAIGDARRVLNDALIEDIKEKTEGKNR